MDVKNINGELMTLEQCLEEHKGTVYKFARKYRFSGERNGLEQEDLVSAGFEGLIKAYKNFKLEYNTKFSTFSFVAVERQIKREIQTSFLGAKVPIRIKKMASLIIAKGWLDRNVEELSQDLEESVERVEWAIEYTQNNRPYYFEESVLGVDGDELTWLDTIGLKDDTTRIHVEEFLVSLDFRERHIMKCLFKGKTQQFIGQTLDLSQTQIHRLIKKIQKKYMTFNSELVG